MLTIVVDQSPEQLLRIQLRFLKLLHLPNIQPIFIQWKHVDLPISINLLAQELQLEIPPDKPHTCSLPAAEVLESTLESTPDGGPGVLSVPYDTRSHGCRLPADAHFPWRRGRQHTRAPFINTHIGSMLVESPYSFTVRRNKRPCVYLSDAPLSLANHGKIPISVRVCACLK